MDGDPLGPGSFTPIGASGFGWAVVPVESGPHRAKASAPFGLTVHGNQDANYVPGGLPSAYEYPGGLDLRETIIAPPK